MGDSIYIPAYQSLGNLLSEGLKAGSEFRDLDRKRKLQEAYNASINTEDNSFDNLGFMARAKEAGIGLEADPLWMKRKNELSDSTVKEAENADQLDYMGRTPDRLRDWFEQERQNKERVQAVRDYETKQEQQTQQAHIDKQTGADQFLPPAATTTQSTPTTTNQEMETVEGVKSVGKEEMDLGSGRVGGALPSQDKYTMKLPDPGYYGAGGVDPKLYDKPIDSEKKYDIIEEALRRKPQAEGGAGAGIDTISNPIEYEKMGNYKGYADNYLSKSGLPSGQAGLNAAFELYSDGVKKPVIKRLPSGKIDRSATEEDKARYNAELRQAAEKFRIEVLSGNTKTIEEKLAKVKDAREQEKQDYDLAGQKGDLFVGKVSKEEAARVKVLNETIDDVRSAKKMGGFEGDYSAALAKARADGSVNADAIIANLVSMGTVPSAQAIAIKALLNPNGGVADPVAKAALSKLYSSFKTDYARRNKWYDSTLENMNEALSHQGGKKREIGPGKDKPATPPPAKKPDPVRDELEKKVRGVPGSKTNPIKYERGMKTYKGKWYNVGGVLSEGKR